MTKNSSSPPHDDRDPLIGDDLLSIALHSYHVDFVFGKSVVQVGAEFVVKVPGRPDHRFSPVAQRGDTNCFWSLLGLKVTKVAMGGVVEIDLDNGARIVVPPSDKPRGSIMGRQDMTYEDF